MSSSVTAISMQAAGMYCKKINKNLTRARSFALCVQQA